MTKAVTIVSVVTVQEGNAMETAETAIAEAVIVRKIMCDLDISLNTLSENKTVLLII